MIKEVINGAELFFETDKTLFSPLAVDKGTLAMLSVITFSETDKVLDLGCGYGAVGIAAAKRVGLENVLMSDINEKCIELSNRNAEYNGAGGIRVIQSDGFNTIDEKDFTLIISNPPYHNDFSVAKHFIEKGFNRLALNGKMYMVTKRKDWYKNKFTAIFGGVKIIEIDGYYIFSAEKRSTRYANKKCK